MINLGEGDINKFPLGTVGEKSTKLLWTIDDKGAHFALEDQPWDSTRPDGSHDPSHTNLSGQAYAGGEAWRTGPNQLTVNAASGAFGYRSYFPTTPSNDPRFTTMFEEGAARFSAAIRYFISRGLEIEPLPYGPQQ